jgi:hypothetical protein
MTNTHGKVANVDDIRGIHSSFGMHYYSWWWRPTSYWEAMKSAQKEEWVMAMKEEMDSLIKNDT